MTVNLNLHQMQICLLVTWQHNTKQGRGAFFFVISQDHHSRETKDFLSSFFLSLTDLKQYLFAIVCDRGEDGP